MKYYDKISYLLGYEGLGMKWASPVKKGKKNN